MAVEGADALISSELMLRAERAAFFMLSSVIVAVLDSMLADCWITADRSRPSQPIINYKHSIWEILILF